MMSAEVSGEVMCTIASASSECACSACAAGGIALTTAAAASATSMIDFLSFDEEAQRQQRLLRSGRSGPSTLLFPCTNQNATRLGPVLPLPFWDDFDNSRTTMPELNLTPCWAATVERRSSER